ncbi:TRPM8 channel-associated factor homolog [Gastrophryne carolinensis]
MRVKGLVQIGCHSDDLSSAKEFCRAPVVVHKKVVLKEKVTISCIWGGLLYIIVKAGSQLGLTPVSVHLMLNQWDKFMAAIADLAAIPKKFPRPERIVADVQISAGWMHSGYPIMCHLQSAKELTDLENMKKAGLWGPIHELGHNEQRGPWEFPPHTTEATCNLWSVYVHETVLGIPRNEAHPALKPKDREDRMNLWAEKFSQVVNKNLAPFFKSWGWPIEETTFQKLATLPAWEENPMTKY